MRPLIVTLLRFLSWFQLLGWLALLWIIGEADKLSTGQAWVLSVVAGFAALAVLAGLQLLSDKIQEGEEQ